MPELPATMFHLADAANEASIDELGLLSTAELLRRRGTDARTLRSATSFRPTDLVLPGGERIRDQSPMPPVALERCLDPGTSPDEWYRLVNAHVFFWIGAERMTRHKKALRRRPQVLFTIATAALVDAYGDVVYVTPFNIGNARRTPARRGPRTLCPVRTWREHGWALEAPPGERPRPAGHPPAELLVRGAIPDLHRFVVSREVVDPW